ncbi:MAG: tyrosine--tRNA ligase [Bacteroidales bacterium]|jgi:tyrosyl-tRNA synthetase|nr:tyrosine--tRNA ligase [Bacteroidales bacterium]MDD2570544.1 tyrosine--tRNA ligase [Bacteroidales bacterium]MDD2812837.1 tyrosine--tRNA ligase [Bacteroidales bacterium]MDD3386124.1 tyrosine--tRNA ligase [Bacteroidales bacterium]MDD3812059.1 tyrosine--tRNA ligase [Bacteroidales bacterium]
MSFIDELRWRGLIHDIMPGTEELLSEGMTSAYIGFDPSSDSLHIGNLVSILLLRHLQLDGHKPYALVGGATGMIGDPSGKSEERNLLDEKTLRENQESIKKQLARFLDFSADTPNAAVMVNNYDWMKNFSFLEFIRDIGKHITVNYMTAKDSVKKRLDSGMSFTEFTYQLVQGYDYLHLYQNFNVKLQMGGSDQWGNITTGTELIRRKAGGEAFALTSPLITKADGGKFGKTESGTIWLDAEKTSPYHFYQFWLNAADDDAINYIRIFTFLPKEEIEELIAAHSQAPHERLLQRKLAEEVTRLVHSEEALHSAIEATQILFGKGTHESLAALDEKTLLSIFEGVPIFQIDQSLLEQGVVLIDLLAVHTAIFPSKGEARRTIQGGGVSLNKEKMSNADEQVNKSHLIGNRFLLVQKGKKQYYLIRVN